METVSGKKKTYSFSRYCRKHWRVNTDGLESRKITHCLPFRTNANVFNGDFLFCFPGKNVLKYDYGTGDNERAPFSNRSSVFTCFGQVVVSDGTLMICGRTLQPAAHYTRTRCRSRDVISSGTVDGDNYYDRGSGLTAFAYFYGLTSCPARTYGSVCRFTPISIKKGLFLLFSLFSLFSVIKNKIAFFTKNNTNFLWLLTKTKIFSNGFCLKTYSR